MTTVIKIPLTGREVDVSRVLPLTIGDLRKLKSKGVTMAAMQGTPDFDVLFIMLELVLTKACPDITQEEIDSVPANELNTVMSALQAADEPDPTTPSS